jgi:cytoskeletal protein CcmA (bactofilin family)
MFGRKRNKAIQVTKLSSLVADNLEIVGDVLFTGGLRVDGRIEGNVLGKEGERSLLVLSNKGSIVGRVKAYDAVINGSISGDLEVEHFLDLQANAHVSGNIIYRQLQMDCGAVVEGQLEKKDVAATDGKVVDIATSTPHTAAR